MRRTSLALALTVALSGLLAALGAPPAGAAEGTAWPARPVRWIVPYVPGGPTDLASRALAQQLSVILRQPFTVDNRAGGGTTVGLTALARSAPDGYTIGTADNGLVFTAGLNANLPYDPERELVPVMQYGTLPFVLAVQAALPVRSVQELIALARAQPGQLTFGTPGVGSPHHLYMELFKVRTGTDIVHVPYKGGAPLVQDLAAGRISMSTSNLGLLSGMIKAGRVRALAVTSASRMSALPELPTLDESGLTGYAAGAWQGVMVPASTSQAQIEALGQALAQAVETIEVRKVFQELGIVPTVQAGAAFAEFIQRERAQWIPLIRSMGLKAD